MKRLLKVAAALVCSIGLTAFASTSNVTATLTDSDGQTWNNCTWQATLISPRGNPTIAGSPISASLQLVQGSCNATGALSGAFVDVNSLDQSGATYTFTMQPNASVASTTVAGIVVTGASPNLSATLSGNLKGPRFNASPGSFGYADGEVLQLVPIGGTYYNVTTPCLRQYSLAGWTCGGGGGSTFSYTVGGLGTLYGFGDSTMSGSIGPSAPTTSAFALLARDYPGQASNQGVGGAYMANIAAFNFKFFHAIASANSINMPVVYENGGINDANAIGATTGALNNYKLQLSASAYWIGLPLASKTFATSATASGFSAGYNGPIVNFIPVGSGAKQSITNGDTLTFTGTAVGNEVGLTYLAQQTGTGTFTVSVNGTLQTDVCSGTTTFSAFGCNSQAVQTTTFSRQEFAVTPGAAYTVVVTVTGTTGAGNTVAIVDVDTIPTSKAGLVPFIMSGVLRQNLDASAAATAAFNAADSAVVTQAIADNLNAYFVDVRTGKPGVNTTTDMAATSIPCPASASNTPLHPNDCGQADLAQTVENTVPQLFNVGVGSKVTTFMGPLSSTTAQPSTDLSYNSWNSNIANITPSTTQWSPVYCSYSPSTHIDCTGINWSATQGTFTNGLFSLGTVAVQHCTSYTSPGSCTDSAFWDILGNQHALAGYIGPATEPTGACPTNGIWQFTQDGHASVCLSSVWTQKF